VGGRRFQHLRPSSTVGSLGLSYQQCHKSRVSLGDPVMPMLFWEILMERCATFHPYELLLPNIVDLQAHRRVTNLLTLAFGIVPLVNSHSKWLDVKFIHEMSKSISTKSQLIVYKLPNKPCDIVASKNIF
jgi:hypothetical protein